MSERFEFKVVVGGPFGAGKTTLISSITDGHLVGTEVPTSGAEATVKDTTTVGMEYGTFVADGGDFAVDLNIYGVPGQERFSFMWNIVGRGMDGFILLVDATNPDGWTEAARVVEFFRSQHPVPVIIAVNRADDDEAVLDMAEEVISVPDARYLVCDPRDPVSAKDTLIELLFLVLDAMPEDDDEELSAEDEIIESARLAAKDDASATPVTVGEPAGAGLEE